jgi:hypothetical protein
MVLAQRLAAGIQHEALAAAPGPYVLGATTPDIRVLTRQDRVETHFFDLHRHEHQDSVAAFLETHAGLADPASLAPDTIAFVAGYLTHLVMDEQYITQVYRRFFARYEELGGIIRANVMDRLLQFDLEHVYGDDPEVVQRLVAALGFTVQTIEAGFVDHDTLDAWRRVNLDIVQRNMDWDRQRGMISRHLKLAGIDEGPELQRFLDSLPELRNETMGYVTNEAVEGFIQRSTEAAARAVERYLRCG